MSKAIKFLATIVLCLFIASQAIAAGTGKLQIHFIDVGQGDSALLISPEGETVLFDDGVYACCDKPVNYLKKIGITKIDYHILSHYDEDHIGCTKKILDQFPLVNTAYDRGETPPKKTSDIHHLLSGYREAVTGKRETAQVGQKIVLDSASQQPTAIEFIALNGDGIKTTNENDLSLVSVVHYGNFDLVMGGDISGEDSGNYKDVESTIAQKVKKVEVYKVNHHCSSTSTNATWLSIVKPKVGIISLSAKCGQNYHHPKQDCLNRLHTAGVKTYWTEDGDQTHPDPTWDKVGGNIVVEVPANSDSFTVTYGPDGQTNTDSYTDWGTERTVTGETNTATGDNNVNGLRYAWSKNSKIYHYEDCTVVDRIAPANLETATKPPAGKTLHTGCPKFPK